VQREGNIMRGPIRRASRFAAYAASASLAISGTLLAVTPAGAAPTPTPAAETQGAAWLQGQLTNGVLHNAQYDFDDIALSADFAYALDAVGGHGAAVDSILDAIEPRAHDEWYTSTFNNVTTTYGGSIAKLLVLVQQTGGTPISFGGQNLVSLLDAQVATAAPIAGRVQNTNDSFGDANTIGQAYAAHGLTTASSSNAAAATAFLLKQQCSSGYFRLSFTADKTAIGQSCVNGTDAPDTDATAIAVLQLQSQSTDGTVSAAITSAQTWLAAQQKTDGSFGGGTSTEASNANSTGLAALALGSTPASAKAAQWIRAHQATYYDDCDKLAAQRGAVAYGDAALAAGRSGGITTATADQFRRASAQAVPALVYLPADTTPAAPVLTGPGSYLKAGTRQVLTTSGVGSGDQLCLTGTGAALQGTATGPTWRSTVTLPAGTANRVYAVRDAEGHADTATLKVLGAKTLPIVTSKYKVKKKRYVTAMITGLVPSEWARIYYKGAFVRSGHATSTGKFVATFKVGKAKGKKSITGFGFFTDIRRGATTIKVVR
jgi:hypothetical protein